MAWLRYIDNFSEVRYCEVELYHSPAGLSYFYFRRIALHSRPPPPPLLYPWPGMHYLYRGHLAAQPVSNRKHQVD